MQIDMDYEDSFSPIPQLGSMLAIMRFTSTECSREIDKVNTLQGLEYYTSKFENPTGL